MQVHIGQMLCIRPAAGVYRCSLIPVTSIPFPSICLNSPPSPVPLSPPLWVDVTPDACHESLGKNGYFGTSNSLTAKFSGICFLLGKYSKNWMLSVVASLPSGFSVGSCCKCPLSELLYTLFLLKEGPPLPREDRNPPCRGALWQEVCSEGWFHSLLMVFLSYEWKMPSILKTWLLMTLLGRFCNSFWNKGIFHLETSEMMEILQR